MCAGAIVNARLDRVVFGAYDENGGAVISKTELFADFGYSPDVVGGYMEKECTEVLTGFFKKRRDTHRLSSFRPICVCLPKSRAASPPLPARRLLTYFFR